jgi:hypothetical protein
VSVSAVTDSGNPVNEGFTYYHSEGPLAGHGGFLGEFAAKGIPYPRVQEHCKFADMLSFMVPPPLQHTATQLPYVCVNMNNFARVEPLPPPKDENV